MSIRQRLEDVRQQRDQLAPVPGLNKEYAQSLLDANRLRELAGEEFEAYRQQLAVTVHEKTLARFKDLAQAKAKELGAERGIRDGLAKELRQLEADYNNQGGNAISAIEQSLENARVGLKLRQQVEESARKALSDAGLELRVDRGRLGAGPRARGRPLGRAEGRLGGAQGAALRGVRRPRDQETRARRGPAGAGLAQDAQVPAAAVEH